MSERADIVWDRLSPEELEYCEAVGAQRNRLRIAAGHRNRVANPERAEFFNIIGVKGEFAFAAKCGLHYPTAGQPDDRYDFKLSRYRIDVKTNATLRHKNLLVPNDRFSPPEPHQCDILLLAGTSGIEDPWVGLIGWISVASWLKVRRAMLWGKDKRSTFVVPQERLNPIHNLPGWPLQAPTPAPAYQNAEGDQKRLL